MTILELVETTDVPHPREAVFGFFSDPRNLAVLSPPWVRVDIPADRPVSGSAGMEFEYRVRVRGLPIRWRGRFEVWEPPERFVDVQLSGPYRYWRHEHGFEETADGRGTRLVDRVRFAAWGGRWVGRWVVLPELRRMFAYRRRRLRELFPEG